MLRLIGVDEESLAIPAPDQRIVAGLSRLATSNPEKTFEGVR
jgi:hypothetical protein